MKVGESMMPLQSSWSSVQLGGSVRGEFGRNEVGWGDRGQIVKILIVFGFYLENNGKSLKSFMSPSDLLHNGAVLRVG